MLILNKTEKVLRAKTRWSRPSMKNTNLKISTLTNACVIVVQISLAIEYRNYIQNLLACFLTLYTARRPRNATDILNFAIKLHQGCWLDRKCKTCTLRWIRKVFFDPNPFCSNNYNYLKTIFNTVTGNIISWNLSIYALFISNGNIILIPRYNFMSRGQLFNWAGLALTLGHTVPGLKLTPLLVSVF